MDADQNLGAPASLVVEYKSMALIVRGGISIALIITLLIFTEALTNIIAVVALSAWFIVALIMLRKAYLNTAFTLTDQGINIHGRNLVEWRSITEFSIETERIESDVIERILVKSKTSKDHKFDLEDLSVSKDALHLWLDYYKAKKKIRPRF